jgi:Uma2 family endonuclease
MAMPDTTGNWTVAMLDALPDDGQRYEIIDGVLFVTPAPRVSHQHVVTSLAVILAPYVARTGGAIVLVAPTDVRKGERTSVQPDVLVVRLDANGRVAVPIQPRDLFLAIEVLSDRTARTDRQDKRVLYQGEGVAEYWIVDADAWVIERWRPGDQRPEVLSERLDWLYGGATAPLAIDLPSFFATIVRD